MKNSELKKKLETFVSDLNNKSRGVNEDGDTYKYRVIDREKREFARGMIEPLCKLITEYLNTPLEERKDEKRWYIHLFDDEDKYLNLNKKRGSYDINNQAQTIHHQTKFTRSEIEDWAGTNSDEVIDWIIDKFGEEVE